MNKKTFEKLQTDLENLIEKKGESLENAENADYPNEDRCEKLQSQIDCLEEMMSNVEEYIDLCE